MREKYSTNSINESSTPEERKGFVPIREASSGWLLFLYDPERELIEIQRRGRKTVVDLRKYRRIDR